MAVLEKKRAREVQLGFEAISIEGGLLSPEWLSRIAQLSAGAQSEADYRIPKGLNLRDEIGRYWRIAQAHWNEFDAGFGANAGNQALAERFIRALLQDAFGYTSLVRTGPVTIAERGYPIGLAALNGRVPVVVAPAGSGLDALATTFGDGGRRRSAFGLAQEYLNAREGALWGMASDGLALRVVRDNASLTRPAWIEADLQRIFTEERYADFAALWLLMHESRFGRADQPVTECALEGWRNAGREEGTRAREHLRLGVEDALLALGQGFLSHPGNQQLRADLRNGLLSTKDYFNQLLRLVYRLIFLLTVEERGLLHAADASEEAMSLYASGYSLRRLRDRSVKRSLHDRFSDLWEGTKVVLKGVASGEPRLGLPALAGIFAHCQCPNLDAAELENRALLLAVFRLAWLREGDSLARVNWRDMGPEELGSVYESLLELVAQITSDCRQFSFATGGDTKGNARKTTGSYYTPDSLVQVLLDSALEPVVAETVSKNPGNPIEALLGLSIVDPACGSGHFLLAAARRLAAHVARIRANGTPSAAEYRHALRQVVGKCIYGVDLNPMAVELCKVSLWMEAVEPGLPLTFLNSHIQHGNALLGTTPELMAQGIPDSAWEPIEGDDKKVASLLKKRNKAEAGGQRTFALTSDLSADESRSIDTAVIELEATPDVDVAALVSKEEKWEDILESPAYRHQKFAADAWCAAFVWPKQQGGLGDAAPSNELWRQIRDGVGQLPALTAKTVHELAEQYRFFHWRLQFRLVFAKGGFDVVLGNPPWDKIQPEEVKFFAATHPDIANATSAASRKKLISNLPDSDPRAHEAWCAHKRLIDGTCAFLRSSGVLKYSGDGNLNSYRVFTEVDSRLMAPLGRVGLIVQTGLATDESGKELFYHLLSSGRLVQFLDFENRERIFADVDERFRFALITIKGSGSADAKTATKFGWLLHKVHDASLTARLIELDTDDVLLFNPSSRTAPVVDSPRALGIARRIYRAAQHVMLGDVDRFGSIDFLGELFNMTRDSGLFQQSPSADSLPLYEAKFIHQFDHRFATATGSGIAEAGQLEKADATFKISPKSYVAGAIVRERLSRRGIASRWLCGFRDIASATNERTVIFSLLPPAAVGNSINLVLGLSARQTCLLGANANSFAFDYCARQKISGTHVNIWIFKQLPVIRIEQFQSNAVWAGAEVASWVLPRFLELVYTAWDLEPFARDLGYDGPPFRWDIERRFLLRCELDAAFFHLYGLSREDTDYMMDTFPIVRRNDEKLYGEYRTKRMILEIYDAITRAVRSGKPYQTHLNPPPADSRVAHSPRTGVVVQFPRQTSAPRRLPIWGDAIVAEAASRAQVNLDPGAWSTTWTGEDLGMAALAAVLRNVVCPMARAEVERAVVLAVLPRLMQPNLDGDCGKQWRRAIGSNNLAVDSIRSLGIPWNAVLRKAIQQGVLVKDGTGNWAAGPDVGDAPSAVLDARAIVVLSWLATTPAESSEVSSQVVALRVA